jgi:cytochrome c-type biogenesis protein CcmH
VRAFAVVVAALVVAAPAAAGCAQPKTSLPYLEGQIMCPTCHTTLDQSDAPAALRIEHRIQVLIDRCYTADQVKADLVRNFGAGILAAPPRKGFDLLAWWLPLGGIVLGALLLALGVWRWTRSRAPDAAEPPLDPDLDRRVDELLARYE